YDSVPRCPRCGVSWTAPRMPALGTVTRAPAAPKRVSKRVALALIAGILGAVGTAYGVALRNGGDSGAGAAAAVDSFFQEMVDGSLRESLAVVHPHQRERAERSLSRLLGTGLSHETIARAVVKAVGRGAVGYEVRTRRPVAEDRWLVEVVVRSSGAEIRSAWIPVSRNHGKWYVDQDPFEKVSLR